LAQAPQSSITHHPEFQTKCPFSRDPPTEFSSEQIIISSMTSTAASNLAGLWLGGTSELAAAVQGTWQPAAAAAGGGDPGPRLQKQRTGGEKAVAVRQGAAAAGGRAAKEWDDGNVGRCGGAMSDTTLYLLLDRFAPS
jgi:hypothetical protein